MMGAADDSMRRRGFSFNMRRASLGLLVFLSLAVSALAVKFAFRPLSQEIQSPHLQWLYVHIFASVFALALGPFQFSATLRKARIRLHRLLGRLYLGVGVVAGGVSGLLVAFYSPNQFSIRLSFACLALVWLYTGLRAYRAIRVRDIEAHRRWMIRNFALTFAAVTFRIIRPLLVGGFGIPDELGSELAAWLCWIPNLLAVELWLSRPQRTIDAIKIGNPGMSLESNASTDVR